jgi:hypothetical protein
VSGDSVAVMPKFVDFNMVKQIGSGIGLAASLFVLTLLFSGYSTVSRWAGLEPFPYAIITISCLAVGSIFSLSPLAHTPISWIICVAAVGFLSFGKASLAFAGGCLLAALVPSLLIIALKSITQQWSRVFLLAFCSWNFILTILSYVTCSSRLADHVLYGRPWVPLLLAVTSFGAAFSSFKWIDTRSHPSWFAKFRSLFAFPLVFVTIALFLPAGPGHLPSTLRRASGKVPQPKSGALIPLQPPVGIAIGRNCSDVFFFSSQYFSCSLSSFLNVFNSQPSESEIEANRLNYLEISNSSCDDPFCGGEDDGSEPFTIPIRPFSVVQLNIKQGYDTSGQVNLELLKHFFSQQQPKPKILGLQEIDMNHMWIGSYDVVEFLSYELQMYDLYASSPRMGGLGVSLMSKYPFDAFSTTWSDDMFPRASCAYAELQIVNYTDLVPLQVFVTIFQGDESDREEQRQSMQDALAVIPQDVPIIWLGELFSMNPARDFDLRVCHSDCAAFLIGNLSIYTT